MPDRVIKTLYALSAPADGIDVLLVFIRKIITIKFLDKLGKARLYAGSWWK